MLLLLYSASYNAKLVVREKSRISMPISGVATFSENDDVTTSIASSAAPHGAAVLPPLHSLTCRAVLRDCTLLSTAICCCRVIGHNVLRPLMLLLLSRFN